MTTMINTNVMSLNSQRNLANNSASLATTIQRLSSGLRINSARDDAAGLAISERFSTQIRGMNVAVRNANDGISLAQTAEGAMGEIGNNLQRIRELAVQSRNATNSASDRAALNAEAQQLKSEIARVAGQTEFNGLKLLDGSFTAQAFQVGANSGQTITVSSITNANIAQLGSWTSGGTDAVAGSYTTNAISAFDFSQAGSVATAGSVTSGAAFAAADFSTDSASFDVDGHTVLLNADYSDNDGIVGAIQTQLDTADNGAYAVSHNAGVITIAKTATGAASTAPVIDNFDGDVDGGNGTVANPFTGGTSSNGADAVAGTNAGFSVDGHVISLTSNVNDLSGLVSALQTQLDAADNGAYTVAAANGGISITSTAAGAATPVTVGTFTGNGNAVFGGGTAVAGADAVAGATQTGFAALDISTAAGADDAIKAMDGALDAINSARADMGAVQNRFQSVIQNLQTTSENLSASRSRIRDTDFAKETAELARTQILAQAGTAMLAQANQATQNVLSLLR